MTDETKSAKPSPKTVAPKKTEPVAKAEPAKVEEPRAPYAVFGNGETDEILYSKARVPGPTESRKSVTVLHIQRRLEELGYSEAEVAPGGRYETLTELAVKRYQGDNGADATGTLTREQFVTLFDGDPNVTVSLDTIADH